MELQVTCNGLIRDDLEVKIIYPSFRDAKTLCPDKKLPQEDTRLVRIGNIDVTPCGCMHVPSLRYWDAADHRLREERGASASAMRAAISCWIMSRGVMRCSMRHARRWRSRICI
ncbi:MAG: hypothetical protein V8T10_05800 [Merdibacter sp.]